MMDGLEDIDNLVETVIYKLDWSLLMEEPVINCPNCNTEIKLTETLAGPLIETTRKEFEGKAAEKELEIKKREETLRKEQKKISEAQGSINEQVAEKLQKERIAIAADESKKAKQIVGLDLAAKDKELASLQEILDQRNTKLEQAQKEQANLLKKGRELDDQKREMNLTIEKRVEKEVEEVRKKAKTAAEGSMQLKVLEKEQQIASMQRTIEDLKRKAEQGSQQLQGEVQEINLEEILKSKFPLDNIEPVPKGVSGADVVQHVVDLNGVPCGTILWESKRTKKWSDGWLAKLRTDQRAEGAEISILMSQALPKDIESFSQIDGVWVTAPKYSLPLVTALRQTLIEVAVAKYSKQGQQTKAEMVYDYLISHRFRHRVEAIIEKFSDMQTDLDRERKAMTRLWAKRDTQIQTAIESTVGMVGDLQGIAGAEIQEIEGLEMPLLENPGTED